MAPSNHVLIVPITSGSHIRVIIQFTLNLLTFHPSLVATILIGSIAVPRIEKEISLQPEALVSIFRDRIQLKVVEDGLAPGAGGAFIENNILKERAGPALDELLEGKGQGRFAAVPCMVINDASLRQSSVLGTS